MSKSPHQLNRDLALALVKDHNKAEALLIAHWALRSLP